MNTESNSERVDNFRETRSVAGIQVKNPSSTKSRSITVKEESLENFSNKSPSTKNRLAQSDVSAIFNFLYDQGPRPQHLHFVVVNVGSSGQKLSPPSWEFPLGIYILLEHEKRRTKTKRVPPHLEHLLMHENLPDICPWQLSGPQYTVQGSFQQRYCYPKGAPEYSNRTGSALWTMYGQGGKEEVKFRILQVYFSNKRAVNRGRTIPSSVSASPSPAKRSKVAAKHVSKPSNASTISSKDLTPPSSSGFETVVPSGPRRSYPYLHPTPYPSLGHQPHVYQPHAHDHAHGMFSHAPPLPSIPSYYHHHHHSSHLMPKHSPLPTEKNQIEDQHHIFRRAEPASPKSESLSPSLSNNSLCLENISSSPHPKPPPSIRRLHAGVSFGKSRDSMDTKSTAVADSLDIDSTSLRDVEGYWNDPLESMMLSPNPDSASSLPVATLPPFGGRTPSRALVEQLCTLQFTIRELILQTPSTKDQEKMMSTVVKWAKDLAQDPLGDPVSFPSLETPTRDAPIDTHEEERLAASVMKAEEI